MAIPEHVIKEALYASARDFAQTAAEQENFDCVYHHVGDDTGRIILAAFREYGDWDAMVIVVEYLTTLNRIADARGKMRVPMDAVIRTLSLSLRTATPYEVDSIEAAVREKSLQYWGERL